MRYISTIAVDASAQMIQERIGSHMEESDFRPRFVLFAKLNGLPLLGSRGPKWFRMKARRDQRSSLDVTSKVRAKQKDGFTEVSIDSVVSRGSLIAHYFILTAVALSFGCLIAVGIAPSLSTALIFAVSLMVSVAFAHFALTIWLRGIHRRVCEILKEIAPLEGANK